MNKGKRNRIKAHISFLEKQTVMEQNPWSKQQMTVSACANNRLWNRATIFLFVCCLQLQSPPKPTHQVNPKACYYKADLLFLCFRHKLHRLARIQQQINFWQSKRQTIRSLVSYDRHHHWLKVQPFTNFEQKKPASLSPQTAARSLKAVQQQPIQNP